MVKALKTWCQRDVFLTTALLQERSVHGRGAHGPRMHCLGAVNAPADQHCLPHVPSDTSHGFLAFYACPHVPSHGAIKGQRVWWV